MHTDSIIIGSITYAMKARNALNAQGLHARMKKFQNGRTNGCNYGLEIPGGNLLTVAAILRPLNIPYQVL